MEERAPSKLDGDSLCWDDSCQVSVYLGWRAGGVNGTASSFVLREISQRSLPPQQLLTSLSHIPQASLKLLFLYCISVGLLCCIFKGGDSISYHHPVLPKLSLLFYKVLDVKPH